MSTFQMCSAAMFQQYYPWLKSNSGWKIFGVLFLAVLFCTGESQAEIKFIPNKGQWDTEAKFRAEIPGGFLYVFHNKIFYQFIQIPNYHTQHVVQAKAKTKKNKGHEITATIHGIEVFFGNSIIPEFHPGKPSSETFNFFYGQDATKWASGIHGYKELMLRNVYQGISLKLHFTEDHLKYDWCIEPGANTALIQLSYIGIDSMALTQGNLKVWTGPHTIIEDKPISYSVDKNDLQTPVPSRYVLHKNVVSYQFPSGFDHSKKLVVDPKIIFSSYSGSYSDNYGNAATYDGAGNLYTGGTAYGTRFPVVPAVAGGFKQSLMGISDVVIMKFSADGKALLFSTYLGGREGETPHSMIVNEQNELIIMGSTSSLDFPFKNGYDPTYNGGSRVDPLGYGQTEYRYGSDIFLTKFSSNGAQLISGTYLGGAGNDGIIEIESSLCKNYGDQFRGEVNLDQNGNILISSTTSSPNFPVNGHDKNYNRAAYEGVLTKTTPDLSSIIWSTYLGGSRESVGLGVSIDQKGNIFVCGGIYNNLGDAYLQKYSETGQLLGSKVIGTSNYDQAYLIQSDTMGNVYIMGQTKGSFPVTNGVYYNRNAGQFIQKYSNSLDLLFSTVVGSGKYGNVINPDISPTAFLVNECGMIYLAGWGGRYNNEENDYGEPLYVGGNTRGMPLATSAGQTAYQSSTDGSDFYIMILERDAAKLVYATYFGGSDSWEHVDGGTSRFDKKGNIYECVCACFTRSGFPSTPGVVSNTNNTPSILHQGTPTRYPDCNNAAFKFNLGDLKAGFETYSSSNEGPGFNSGCAPLRLNLVNTTVGGQIYNWTFDDLTTFSGFSPGRHTYDSAGQYKITLIVRDDATCIKSDTVSQLITVKDFNLLINAKTQICKDSTATLSAIANLSEHKIYQWSLDNKIFSNEKSITVKPLTQTTYSLSVKDTIQNCVKNEQINIRVYDVKPEISSNLDGDCEGKTTILFNNNGKDAKNFQWSFGDDSFSQEESPQHTYSPGKYTIHYQGYNEMCSADTTVNIEIQRIFYPNLFTPNNDAQNEKFEVKGTGGNWKLQVYDRWGGRVAHFENYNNQWDGANVEDGIYYFLLTSPYNRQCKGWVEIIR